MTFFSRPTADCLRIWELLKKKYTNKNKILLPFFHISLLSFLKIEILWWFLLYLLCFLCDDATFTLQYIYIYIYCHPQTDCFILSEIFSVARHAGRSKPGSKPVQLYVRLSLRPLGHQVDHIGYCNFLWFCV